MNQWWLYTKQPDANTDVPLAIIIVLYVVATGSCLLLRALTWPENEPVNALFFVSSVILPICLVSMIIYIAFIFHNASIHYFETRKFIAKEHEIYLKAYARKNVALAAWSVITPLEQPALNMLKLEGEFPLAPKTPVKIELEERFDQTRNELLFNRLLAPMSEKLKGYNYRIYETVIWARGGNETCIEELKRSLERLGVEHVSTCKIEYSTECPDYTLISKWTRLPDYRVENRLIIIVDLHDEDGASRCMENACAFLLTNHYVPENGEKPVYLYQPMAGVTDVEEKLPIYLEAGPVLTPKTLWYTGLSRTEKYPLMEALNEKGQAQNRLDVDASLGAKSAGYRWLALALAADAVKYAQGEQLVASSEQNKFSITALSSQKTAIPAKTEWATWSTPLLPGGLAALFCIFSFFAYLISFPDKNDILSLWGVVASIIISFVVFIGAGFYVFILKTNEAYEDMSVHSQG